THRNLFLTMVISGLWHGAAWTFVIWGALHALATMATRSAARSDWYRRRVPKFVKQIMVFGVVWFAWIFFRADSLSDAWLIVTRIFTADWLDPEIPLLALLLVGTVWLYQFMYESAPRRFLDLPAARIALMVLMILYLSIVPGSGGAAFIYFQF
ncbi:MAG: MBOAT family protein, partial [Planctomycetia bacterium]|nr:MBOAT family protein [Planctomycetia bacterium]